MELYKKHRPKKSSEIIGQAAAISCVKDWVQRKEIPHAILFSGPSGCGKTTLARMLRNRLKCSPQDFVELNAASTKGIDVIRGIGQRMRLAPLGGESRIWLIDECHKLTNDAQNAFLKMLEDTPDHVYFFLATTDPNKLLKTIRTRCSDVALKSLSVADCRNVVRHVLALEKREMADDVIDKIANLSDGSARKAVVLLNSIFGITDTTQQLEALQASDVEAFGIDIARQLMNPHTNWKDVAAALKKCNDDPETIRRIVMGYCSSVILGGGPKAERAAAVLGNFIDDFHQSGKPGLVFASWSAMT